MTRPRHRLAAPAVVAAVLAATVAAVVAIPAAAATAAPQVLGRRAVTFQSPPTGPALAKWLSSSQGQFVDTNGNGLRDSLQGRGADLEDFGIVRFREDYVRLQAHLDTNGNGIPDTWVTKLAREADVVTTQARAYGVILTPTARVCFATDALREYRVVHSVLFRRSADSAVGRRTLASNPFTARRLATDPDCTTPPAQGRLDLTLTANPPSPLVGEAFTLTAAARNTGGRVVEEPTFTVDLPDAWTVADASVAGGTCTVNHTTNQVSCALGALLEPGAERDVSIHVTSAPGADTFTLAGSLSSTTEGVATDIAVLNLTVRPSANLSITKTFTDVAETPTNVPGIQEVDDNFDYTLVVHNGGPSAASGVAVTDTWPAGLDNPATPLPAGCVFNDPSPTTNTGETITCTVASLTNGANATFVVHARTNGEASGDLTNTATVTSDTPDPNTANNSSTLVVDVV